MLEGRTLIVDSTFMSKDTNGHRFVLLPHPLLDILSFAVRALLLCACLSVQNTYI